MILTHLVVFNTVETSWNITYIIDMMMSVRNEELP